MNLHPAETKLSATAGCHNQVERAGEESPVQIRHEAAAALRRATEVVYQIILEKHPTDYRAPLNLGYLARQRGDSVAALSYFEAAAAAEPRRPRPKLEMALELRALSRLDEAEALYLSLLKVKPTLVRALAGLGHIARTRGRPRLALSYYRAAVAANPARADLRLEQAAQLRKLSRFREAEQIYREILLEQPDHAGARKRLRRLPKPEKSGLPPLDRSWLQRETFARAAEWGRNLEALEIPAFGTSLLALAQDFACGASEEVGQDCILLRLGSRTKILPLVSTREEYVHVVKRVAKALRSDNVLGYVSDRWDPRLTTHFNKVERHREFVWHRETISEMLQVSFRKYRRRSDTLMRAGVHIEPIGSENLDRVLACNDRWHRRKGSEGRTTYDRVRTVWTLENLDLLQPLGVRHLGVMLDGDVIGYGVGSYLCASWVAFALSRGDNEHGLATLICRECSKLYPDRHWINAGPAGRKPEPAFWETFTLNAAELQMTPGWIQT